MVLNWLDQQPRRVLAAMCATCIALLAFGMYLQHVVGLVPCPMCIVQRYMLILVAIAAGVTALAKGRGACTGGGMVLVVLALGGAFVAARQSWLQWFPPEVSSCGRDFYGMIENFPLSRVIPMLFRGTGDCTKVDWTFLGLSIANWSFLCFAGIAVVSGVLAWRQYRLP